MARVVLSIDDLRNEDIQATLARAKEFADGSPPLGDRHWVLGLVFLEPSLRTRIGFSTAALRLGWGWVDVDTRRSSPTSMPESWPDTLRTVSGMVDVVVARPGESLVGEAIAEATANVPFLNAGDVGEFAEHPSQALVDLFAIE